MKEGNDKIEISCGDMLTLSQEISSREVKIALMEKDYERLNEDYINVKAQFAKSESGRLEVMAENKVLNEKIQVMEEKIQVMEEKLNALKAQNKEFTDNRIDLSQLSEKELFQILAVMMEEYLPLSTKKVKRFLRTQEVNLSMVLILRGFIEESVPDELKTRILSVINKVMLLPEKPVQPKIEPTINGGQAFFGTINNSEFLGKDKDENE